LESVPGLVVVVLDMVDGAKMKFVELIKKGKLKVTAMKQAFTDCFLIET